MTRILNKTVSQIVMEHHNAALIFEKYGIEFCCNSKHSLQETLEETNPVLTSELMAELEALLTNSPNEHIDPEHLPTGKLIDYIVNVHHRYTKSVVPQIAAYLQRINEKHGFRYPFMKQVNLLFSDLQEALRQHLLKEEKILFPRIRQLDENPVYFSNPELIQDPIDVLKEDHDSCAFIMKNIRLLTSNFQPPENACTTFRLALALLKSFDEDLKKHILAEDEILFPRTLHQLQSQNIF